MGVSLFSFTITVVVMGIQTFLVGFLCRFLVVCDISTTTSGDLGSVLTLRIGRGSPSLPSFFALALVAKASEP